MIYLLSSSLERLQCTKSKRQGMQAAAVPKRSHKVKGRQKAFCGVFKVKQQVVFDSLYLCGYTKPYEKVCFTENSVKMSVSPD